MRFCNKCNNLVVEHSTYCDMCGCVIDADEQKKDKAISTTSDALQMRDIKLMHNTLSDDMVRLIVRRRMLTLGYFALIFGVLLLVVWLNRMFYAIVTDITQLYKGFFMFTNFTNLLISLWFCAFGIAYVRNKSTRFRSWISSPVVVSIVTAYIAVVSLLVMLFLIPFWKGDWVRSLFLERYGEDDSGGGTLLFTHLISFLVMLVYFFIIRNGTVKSPIKKSFIAMIYPMLYFTVTILISLYTDWYPYPFLDPEYVNFNGFVYLAFLTLFIVVIAIVCFSTMIVRNILYKAWYPHDMDDFADIDNYDNIGKVA